MGRIGSTIPYLYPLAADRMDVSGPDDEGGEFDEGKEQGRSLVVAGGHAPELLQFGDKALNYVARSISLPIVLDWLAPVLSGRDDRQGAVQEEP